MSIMSVKPDFQIICYEISIHIFNSKNEKVQSFLIKLYRSFGLAGCTTTLSSAEMGKLGTRAYKKILNLLKKALYRVFSFHF